MEIKFYDESSLNEMNRRLSAMVKHSKPWFRLMRIILSEEYKRDKWNLWAVCKNKGLR
jgi:hypothetical protein